MTFVKRALVSDAVIISFLGKQTFTETFGYLFDQDEMNEYLDSTFSIGKLEKSLLSNRNIFGILYYKDKPVGYYKVKVGMSYDNSFNQKHSQLQKIYILSEFLHLKLGNAMLDSILGLKEVEGHEMIWLVVLHSNCRAIKFYENYGFKKLRKYYHTIGLHRLEYELMTKSFHATASTSATPSCSIKAI